MQYNFDEMGRHLEGSGPNYNHKQAFLSLILATGTCGSIPGQFTVSPSLALAATLLSGALSPVYGGTCTSSGRSAAIRGLFPTAGKMLILTFWAVLGSPNLAQ